MAGGRIPKLVTRCSSCARTIGVRPDFGDQRVGVYRVAAHPGCGGGGIRVTADETWLNPDWVRKFPQAGIVKAS